jgi:hypothetical protein
MQETLSVTWKYCLLFVSACFVVRIANKVGMYSRFKEHERRNVEDTVAKGNRNMI